MVHTAYGDEAIMQSNIFRWYGRFREGQEDKPQEWLPLRWKKKKKNVQ
jgi:hypothetical protein